MKARGFPAIVAAGDRNASRAIHGESKVFLELAGRPLVAHVVSTLQDVPEIGEVWVVGDRERLERELATPEFRAELSKPLHLQEQFRNLYENAWQTYRRALPGAGPDGRDPEGPDLDCPALFISADLPFVTAQEISAFLQRGLESGADYAVGLAPEGALACFQASDGKPGIEPAFFNIRDGRLRQNNLHLARPGRIGKLQPIEEMYEHRHQKEWSDMLGLALRLLFSQRGGLQVAWLFMVLHLSGLADRWRLRRLADRLRHFVSMERVERIISKLLDTRFRFITVETGGAAIDVDTEAEYDAVRERYQEWRSLQEKRATALYGALPAGAEGGAAPGSAAKTGSEPT
ncbi:MAG: nucleotidyltransferase family protein [Myxococcota bacterium]